MQTSQYQDRRQFKRDQRTDAYRELQRKTAAERTKLEEKIRERNATIKKLADKLGLSADEVRALVQDNPATDQAA